MKWWYRPPDAVPDRGAANALLLCAAATLLLHALRQPLLVNLGATLLLAWAGLIVHRGARPPGRWLRALLVAAAVFLVARDYGTLLGRDAGVSFLMLLLSLKLTELRRARDYRLAVFLVYFATLTAFLFSQGPGTAIAAFMLGLATTWALHRINHPGAALELQGFSTALGVMLYALPLMVLLYLFFPRLAGGLIAIPSLDAAGRIGLSDRVAPGSVQQLLGSDAPAMRVFFEGLPPPAKDLYWRALVLNVSDGRSWRAGPSRSAPLPVEAAGAALRYRVLLEPSPLRAVPALGWPAAAPAGAELKSGGVLRAREELRETRRFEIASYLNYRDLDGRDVPRVPQLSPRVRELARELAEKNAPDARSLADAVLRYFREQPFRYTLAPPPLPDDWLAAFLFETRTGYCEHYASAFATLMRAAGVPSRVITGYQGGEWNAGGGFFLVRQSDAHAWVEILVPGEGWVRVDPTAAVAPERVEHGIEALRALEARGSAIGALAPDAVRRLIVRPWWRNLWRGALQRYDAFLVSWNEWISDYDSNSQLRLLQRLGFENSGWETLIVILAAGAALMLTLISVLLFRTRSRSDPVVRGWERFCRKLARAGVARAPHEGPLDFTRRASGALPSWSTALTNIGRLYIQLRYGRPEPGLDREFTRCVQRLRISPGTRRASGSALR